MFGHKKEPEPPTYRCILVYDYWTIIPEEIRGHFIPNEYDIPDDYRMFVVRCRCMFERYLTFLPFPGMRYAWSSGQRFFMNSSPKYKVKEVVYLEGSDHFEAEIIPEFEREMFIRKDYWVDADLEGKLKLFERNLLERAYGGQVYTDETGEEFLEDAPRFQMKRCTYNDVPDDALGLSDYGKRVLEEEDDRLFRLGPEWKSEA